MSQSLAALATDPAAEADRRRALCVHGFRPPPPCVTFFSRRRLLVGLGLGATVPHSRPAAAAAAAAGGGSGSGSGKTAANPPPPVNSNGGEPGTCAHRTHCTTVLPAAVAIAAALHALWGPASIVPPAMASAVLGLRRADILAALRDVSARRPAGGAAAALRGGGDDDDAAAAADPAVSARAVSLF